MPNNKNNADSCCKTVCIPCDCKDSCCIKVCVCACNCCDDDTSCCETNGQSS